MSRILPYQVFVLTRTILKDKPCESTALVTTPSIPVSAAMSSSVQNPSPLNLRACVLRTLLSELELDHLGSGLTQLGDNTPLLGHDL